MIGNRIKQARKYRHQSQAHLAEEVGVTQPSVQHWESGVSEPTTHNLSLIAQHLGVSFEWLATGTGEMLFSVTAEIDNPQRRQTIEDVEILALLKRLPKSKRKSLLVFLESWML